MSQGKITKIAFTAPAAFQRKRVAAYARVSSGKDAMLQSLSAQVSYYSDLIQKHSDWQYLGVYADEAMTGTRADRDNFQRLLEDCRAGKIDMVITKSISRFARNTVTLLETVRELKRLGIDVFFEEQNIHTQSSDGELMLTILASYAQEESRSVSENKKWRIRKDFKEGKISCCTMLGYRSRDGVLEIVPEEADTVRLIFKWYLDGLGKQAIVNRLNEMGIPTRYGNEWNQATVGKMLRNEKYAGDLLLQKTFQENHLTKKTLRNNGELPQYLVEEAHKPIIDRETFTAVQAELERRAEEHPAKRGTTSIFTSMVHCGICGKNYRRKTTPHNIVWICATLNTKGKKYCASKQIPEDILIETTRTALSVNDAAFEDFSDCIDFIEALSDNRLVYHFKDGRTYETRWQDHSRADSWTEEMKQAARNKRRDS